METTKLSTKGQVVIPEVIRKDLQPGTAFTVFRKGVFIVLKEAKGLTKAEQREMEELDEIWKGIDAGKGITVNEEEFRKEMETW